jgi:hypothetical protein
MSQVQPGGDRSDRRPGAPARKAVPAKRPAAKTVAAKGRPNGAPKGRPPTRGGPKPRPSAAAGGAKGRAPRQNTTITARPPRRFSPSTMAFASIALVVVIVVVFVVVSLTSGPTKSATRVIPVPTPASPVVVADVTGVPASVTNAVGVGQGVSPPTLLTGQPPLTSGGKPEVLFIGAEFCPLCAAERWAIVQAMSRFGTWSGLRETTSSPWDSDPETPTFSFRSASLSSPYIDFVPVEHMTNDDYGQGTRTIFQPLTTQENNLWDSYSAKLGISSPGFPFLDIGNKVFVTSNSYDPGLLASLSQQQVAAKLTNTSDPVTQAIVGTANYLTAGVCEITGNQPSSVCSASGVRKAMSSLQTG